MYDTIPTDTAPLGDRRTHAQRRLAESLDLYAEASRAARRGDREWRKGNRDKAEELYAAAKVGWREAFAITDDLYRIVDRYDRLVGIHVTRFQIAAGCRDAITEAERRSRCDTHRKAALDAIDLP